MAVAVLGTPGHKHTLNAFSTDCELACAGLKNVGNTCYMNSSLQCLYCVPELRQALQVYSATGHVPMMQDSQHKLTVGTALELICPVIG